MKKMVTKKWLIEQNRCSVNYWDQWVKTKSLPIIKAVQLLITKEKYDWGNWLVVQGMTKKQHIQYAVYAAKQVLHLYEKKYPDDKRPRKAINAALRCIKKDTKKNRNAAWVARDAAEAAARDAARDAARAAAWAARAARDAAKAARDAAEAAADAAWAAAWAARAAARDAAAYAAWDVMLKKILRYGIRILEKNQEEGKGENYDNHV